ncbi:HAD family hydrolase [Myxacorys almedinensis]|uniref:HAD-IA family hydrolase n=1 Tax=Myxacorys almedinensis A TaxID=2690445 RepID=A0A8J7Z3W2_9CYAN|nr:HAD family hydrolase [Myxacorys almedinensis]NDJ17648.1 HAD-IA family hydrolase [Myxacorys almedinensis A]
MPTLRALIFDVDGTLADTERDGHRVAFNRAFADAGLPWNWSVEQYGTLLDVTGGKERIQHYVKTYEPTFAVPGGDLKQFAAALHAGKTEHYKQLLKDAVIPLRPGVKRLLLTAREQGLRLAIATTTTPANVTALLQSSLSPESLSWFEVIAAGDIVPLKKPAPDIFDYALEKLDLAPEECFAFEDSGQGLKSALGAGLRTVITLNEYTRLHDFTGASFVLSDLGEPDAPFEAIAGDVGNATYFDLGLIQGN